MLSKYRRNLSLEKNSNIEYLASYAYGFIKSSIYWNISEDGDFIWEPGMRKEFDDYKYAGKVDGEYQVIPTDEKCAEAYSTDPGLPFKGCLLWIGIGNWDYHWQLIIWRKGWALLFY